MSISHLSSKGQITIPSKTRKRLGLVPGSRLEVSVVDDAIVIRPVKTIREVRGIFRQYAARKPEDWERVRAGTEQAIADEVAREGRD